MSDQGWPAIVTHRERLVAIARRRCPTREDAEDVAHEAMLRSVTFAHLDEARLGQFLTAVTIRLCADVYRDAERTARVAGRLVERDVVESAEDTACGGVGVRVIEGLIETLPVKQRNVLVDRARGLSMSEVCSRHALTYKAAESALARARGALRALLPTALGTLALLAAALRRRTRLVIAAVPVATVVAVGAVVTLPLPTPTHSVAAPPPGHASGALHGDVLERRTVSPPVRAASALRRVAAVTVLPKPVAPEARPVIVVGDDRSFVGARAADNRDEEPVLDTVARCVNDGVWYEIDDDLSDGFTPRQGCGATPENQGD